MPPLRIGFVGTGRIANWHADAFNAAPGARIAGFEEMLDHARCGGGALMDSGSHQVYQSLYLRGRPAAVQGFTARVRWAGDGEDIAQVALQYRDGSTASIVQIWATSCAGRLEGINILGTEGDVVITDRLLVSGKELPGATGYADSFAGQARAFVAAVRAGIPPLMGLDGAADTLHQIELAYRSAREGRVLAWDAEPAERAAVAKS